MGDLKDRIDRVYPGGAPRANQRLVYGGKRLADKTKLRSVFDANSPQPFVVMVSVATAEALAPVVAETDTFDYDLPADTTTFFRWRAFLTRVFWRLYYYIGAMVVVFVVLLGLRLDVWPRLNAFVVAAPLVLAAPAWVLLWWAIYRTLMQAGEGRYVSKLAVAPAFVVTLIVTVPLHVEGTAVDPDANWWFEGLL